MWNKRWIKINFMISCLQFLNFYTLKCQLLHLHFFVFLYNKGVCFAPLHAGIAQKEYLAMNRLVPVKVETGCFLFASLLLVLQAIIAWDSEYKL